MNYQEVVLPILREAGNKLVSSFGRVEVLSQKTDDFWDVVTELDKKTEQFLAEKLRRLDPSIGFSGEELGGDEHQERFWLCDPIDGTVHFVRELPFCTIMLALIEDGQVAFSTIYDFVKGDMYWAERGKGAFKNQEAIRVSTRDMRQSILSLETHIDNFDNREKMIALDQRKCVLFHTACCGFEYAMIASGKLDGRIMLKPYGKVWDYAPGSLLVREAGGVVANIGKETYDYRNLDSLAVNPVIYEELTEGEHAIFPIEK